MGTLLEDIEFAEFHRRLHAAGCDTVAPALAAKLYAHYEVLRRWAPRLALVGAAEATTIVERHYAESLRASALIDDEGPLLDLGSGAGFPGLILAASRPTGGTWLFEARGRKAAFLRAAAAAAELSCQVVNARVSRHQPVTETLPVATLKWVTVRGVRITGDIWDGLEPGLAPGARILRWEGEEAVDPWPEAIAGRTLDLGGRSRKIQEWILNGRTE